MLQLYVVSRLLSVRLRLTRHIITDKTAGSKPTLLTQTRRVRRAQKITVVHWLHQRVLRRRAAVGRLPAFRKERGAGKRRLRLLGGPMELVAALVAVGAYRFLKRVVLPLLVQTVEDITERFVEKNE